MKTSFSKFALRPSVALIATVAVSLAVAQPSRAAVKLQLVTLQPASGSTIYAGDNVLLGVVKATTTVHDYGVNAYISYTKGGAYQGSAFTKFRVPANTPGVDIPQSLGVVLSPGLYRVDLFFPAYGLYPGDTSTDLANAANPFTVVMGMATDDKTVPNPDPVLDPGPGFVDG